MLCDAKPCGKSCQYKATWFAVDVHSYLATKQTQNFNEQKLQVYSAYI